MPVQTGDERDLVSFVAGWNAALVKAASLCDAEAARMRKLEAQPGKAVRAFQGSVADVEGAEAMVAEDLSAAIRKQAV
jgi:hypothetical protein